MTNNSYQGQTRALPYRLAFNEIEYPTKLVKIGTIPAGHIPSLYDDIKVDHLTIDFSKANIKPSGLKANVFQKFGITSHTEIASLRPYIFILEESTMQPTNAKEMLPATLTQMNEAWDFEITKKLYKLARKGTDYTWECGSALKNQILRSVCVTSTHKQSQTKHVIMTDKLRFALATSNSYLDKGNAFKELETELNAYNTTIIICPEAHVETAANTFGYFIVNEPLLSEYTGILPKFNFQNIDVNKYTEFTHFIFSISDFKCKKGSNAVEYYKVSTLDLAKIGEKPCVKKE